jgi:hypothetical protein
MMAMTDMPADRQVLDKDAQLQNPPVFGVRVIFIRLSTIFGFKTEW